MNILIPHTWLLEHLDTQASPEKIQEYLSLCGPSVERIYQTENEPVYDIEVTTNRVDSMSVRGIAREAAVILKQFGLNAQLKSTETPELDVPVADTLPLPQVTNDPKLSKRLICVILKGVQRTPTPDWMAKRLLQTQQTVHDSVIDITNYITHELGHPCHAFDYDKLVKTGNSIAVVEAQKGETFTTLDGAEFTTVGGEVVFKNGVGEIIDLPSIKGTANTSIDDTTTNVLLLLESITAKKVRFASMTHAIRTTAAQLMEKNVDPHLAQEVLLRGAQLYQELCGATIASKILDIFPDNAPLPKVEVSLTKIHAYLGIPIEQEKVVSILEQLGCTVEQTGTQLIVQPPTFRPDLTIPADIIEEIARIYGYHNLPSVLMDTRIPTTRQQGVNFTIENRVKRFLANIGLQEVYTYSMVSDALALQTDSLESHLKLANPLTDDRIYLRKSLIPSLNEVLDQNSFVSNLSVFEIANVYLPRENDLPEETLRLSLVSTLSYQELRGILEALFAQFFVKKITVIQSDSSHGEVFTLAEDKKVVLGNVQMLPKSRVAIELSFAAILSIVKTHPTYQPIPKTAILTEDMTFTLPENTTVGSVLEIIESASPLITSVTLTSTYKRNVSFTITYHNPNENISSESLLPIRKKIVSDLEKLGVLLVGSV